MSDSRNGAEPNGMNKSEGRNQPERKRESVTVIKIRPGKKSTEIRNEENENGSESVSGNNNITEINNVSNGGVNNYPVQGVNTSYYLSNPIYEVSQEMSQIYENIGLTSSNANLQREFPKDLLNTIMTQDVFSLDLDSMIYNLMNTQSNQSNLTENNPNPISEEEEPVESGAHTNNSNNNFEKKPRYILFEGENVIPLCELTHSNRDWEIRVRITNHFSKTYSGWKMEIMDEDLTKGVLFIPAEFIGKCLKLIQIFNVYIISKGSITYDENNTIKIIVNSETEIRHIWDYKIIPQVDFEDYVKVSDFFSQGKSLFHSIVYVADVNDEIFYLPSKDGDYIPYKKILIQDDSFYRCELWLMRDFSELKINKWDVIYVKNLVRCVSKTGLRMETGKFSYVDVDPRCKRNNEIANNIHNYEGSFNFFSKGIHHEPRLANFKEVREVIKKKPVGYDNHRFEVKCTLKGIYESWENTYPGCPTCHTKIIFGMDGPHCKVCDEKCTQPLYLYRLNLIFSDCSDSFRIKFNPYLSEKLLKKYVPNFNTQAHEFREAKTNLNKERNKKLMREIYSSLEFRELILVIKINRVKFMKLLGEWNYIRVVDFFDVEKNEESHQTISNLKRKITG